MLNAEGSAAVIHLDCVPESDKTRWTRYPYADKAAQLATVGSVWFSLKTSRFRRIYHFIDEWRKCHFKNSLLMCELITNENTSPDRNALVPEGQRNMRLKSYFSHQIWLWVVHFIYLNTFFTLQFKNKLLPEYWGEDVWRLWLGYNCVSTELLTEIGCNQRLIVLLGYTKPGLRSH